MLEPDPILAAALGLRGEPDPVIAGTMTLPIGGDRTPTPIGGFNGAYNPGQSTALDRPALISSTTPAPTAPAGPPPNILGPDTNSYVELINRLHNRTMRRAELLRTQSQEFKGMLPPEYQNVYTAEPALALEDYASALLGAGAIQPNIEALALQARQAAGGGGGNDFAAMFEEWKAGQKTE